MGSLKFKMNKANLTLAITDQLKADLATTEQAWDASYASITQA